ncbi:MAG: beta-galactosidase [Firmicutes bacterium]|nr:beta-galactosidase [Bacillota bacterium]
MSHLEFRHGVAHWGGQPAFFISAEYPYFRDDPANWEPRLRQSKELGVRVVSSYIPWRHHEVASEGRRRFDFDGATAAARNVIRFLQLCQQLGLEVLVKPGPFCHAELNYGGLPDFVCPLVRPDIEPRLAADGSAVTWGGSQAGADGRPVPWPLPSPFSAAYRREVRRWFGAVRRQVLGRFCAPQGPIVAMQVGNEGIYSDAQHAVWGHDYSAAALDRFRRWLRRRYGTLAEYNTRHGASVGDWREIEPPRRYTPPDDLRGLLAYADWSEFLGRAMGELYAEYARLLAAPVPALANVNPPVADPWGVDAWLSRVQPAAWGPKRARATATAPGARRRRPDFHPR